VSLPRTPSQTVGPFYAIGLCRRPEHELAPEGIELTGRLLDGQGEPIGDGVVEVWDAAGRRWGRSGTSPDGGFAFRVPRDCDVLDAYVFARGLLRHQRTRIYLRDVEDEALAGLSPGQRETLHAVPLDGGLRFDIRMQGERQTVFFAH
jgi:protocatechuate 3,4-dioxygenase alpha subunit